MAQKDKKYYWLKLKRDFFKRHDIQIIENMANGKDYILFYLKLLCESVDHEGCLRFSEQIPYNEDMLATITNTNVDIVRSAIKIFTQLNMMEIMDDGTYYMSEVNKMLGSESYWAKKKREERYIKQKNVGQCPTLSNESPTCPSKSIEKEIEKEIDKDINIVSKDTIRQTQSVQRVVDEWNTLSAYGIKPISKLASTSKRYKSLVARINEYSVDDIIKAIDNIRHSDFLQGKVKSNKQWVITFDWFVLPNNFPKVFEGNYNQAETSNYKPADQNDDLSDIFG